MDTLTDGPTKRWIKREMARLLAGWITLESKLRCVNGAKDSAKSGGERILTKETRKFELIKIHD